MSTGPEPWEIRHLEKGCAEVICKILLTSFLEFTRHRETPHAWKAWHVSTQNNICHDQTAFWNLSVTAPTLIPLSQNLPLKYRLGSERISWTVSTSKQIIFLALVKQYSCKIIFDLSVLSAECWFLYVEGAEHWKQGLLSCTYHVNIFILTCSLNKHLV